MFDWIEIENFVQESFGGKFYYTASYICTVLLTVTDFILYHVMNLPLCFQGSGPRMVTDILSEESFARIYGE